MSAAYLFNSSLILHSVSPFDETVDSFFQHFVVDLCDPLQRHYHNSVVRQKVYERVSRSYEKKLRIKSMISKAAIYIINSYSTLRKRYCTLYSSGSRGGGAGAQRWSTMVLRVQVAVIFLDVISVLRKRGSML